MSRLHLVRGRALALAVFVAAYLVSGPVMVGISGDRVDSAARARAQSDSASAINTVGYEDSPYLSPDRSRFYFMYTPWSTWPAFFGRPPLLIGPERPGHHSNPDANPWEDSDTYVSVRQSDGTWGTPENLGFNDAQADCCAMTWDERLFAYQRTQWANSALTDLVLVERGTDGTWVRQPLAIPVNHSEARESNPHLAAGGRSIYFTSDRPGGAGGRDLYVSERADGGSWQAPRNLGGPVNTADNEDQIWVSRDERTIYFNRDTGPQLYTATRVGMTWTTPEPVRFDGRLLPGAEASLTDDQLTIVFALVRPDLEDIEMVMAHRLPGGAWRTPVALGVPAVPTGLRVVSAP